MTLEEAQEQIVELTEQVQTLTAERDTLSQNNEQLTTDIENLRTLNQKYFNKLIAQENNHQNQMEGQQDEETKSCEEFAKELDI